MWTRYLSVQAARHESFFFFRFICSFSAVTIPERYLCSL
jgi:hypothetical protein